MTQNEEKKQYKFFQTPKVLKKLDPYEWVLFTVLFDEWQMMKNEEGWFFRSEDVLSEDTGLSTATIYRKTKSLEKKGLILVKRHSDGKTKSKKYKSNDYKINIETVISLAPIESHHREIESHQKDEPTNNIPSNNIIIKENNKIYNINIKTSEDITPDDGTLQDDEVENVFLNNSDDDWLSYELERSMMGEVNNDLKLNNMKKENEMSNKVAIEMNAISEQSERQARENESSESGTTINEMTTSTPGNKNKTSKEFQNIPVDKSKVINNDCNVQGVNPNAKDCAPAPATEEWKPIAWDEDAIFGLGEPKNVSGDKLSTNEEKTQPEPQECPQIEFNRERMLELFKISAKETVLERFKEQLKEMDAYMQYLKKNDNFTYEIYLKEIWSWWNNPMNVWNSDFDFICVGNCFKRKYVA